MPTGYTSIITEKDKEPTFEEFALVCARNFGALLDFRDLSLNQPIPDKFPINNYHKDNIVLNQDKINNLLNSDNDKLQFYFKNKLTEELEKLENSRDERIRNRNRLLKMIESVQQWIPPTTEHEQLKIFMIEQLNLVLPVDGSTEYLDNQIFKLKNKLEDFNLKQMVDDEISKLNHLIEYHQKHYTVELDRSAKNAKWIKQLKDSLKQ